MTHNSDSIARTWEEQENWEVGGPMISLMRLLDGAWAVIPALSNSGKLEPDLDPSSLYARLPLNYSVATCTWVIEPFSWALSASLGSQATSSLPTSLVSWLLSTSLLPAFAPRIITVCFFFYCFSFFLFFFFFFLRQSLTVAQAGVQWHSCAYDSL